jgi:hypothetical protein
VWSPGLSGRRARLVYGVSELLEPVRGDRSQQGLLVGEVPVGRCRADSGGGRCSAQRHRVEAG